MKTEWLDFAVLEQHFKKVMEHLAIMAARLSGKFPLIEKPQHNFCSEFIDELPGKKPLRLLLSMRCALVGQEVGSQQLTHHGDLPIDMVGIILRVDMAKIKGEGIGDPQAWLTRG